MARANIDGCPSGDSAHSTHAARDLHRAPSWSATRLRYPGQRVPTYKDVGSAIAGSAGDPSTSGRLAVVQAGQHWQRPRPRGRTERVLWPHTAKHVAAFL